uniref:Uncharacterized protein n=1 Tax=Myoviridae sp. ctrCp2 TaxID=2825179 RepID=A0A8S5P0E0_9CAUD|nr:MAG TPA: hypothetical protein [Myoviridae sp. ctrCp2]
MFDFSFPSLPFSRMNLLNVIAQRRDFSLLSMFQKV